MRNGEPAATARDLAQLTGVRSGKRSYYREYVRSDARMQRTVRALDSISRALVRTVEGPRSLVDQVARAAGEHLAASWVVLGLTDGALVRARPRVVAIDGDGNEFDSAADLPHAVRLELGAIRAGLAQKSAADSGWVRVPMTLEGKAVGSLVAKHGLEPPPEPGDLSVIRILANQAAVALHTSEQYQAGLELHRRAQQLYAEAQAQSADLATRTAELRRTEQRLLVAHQRELIDAERHRIARELHDSVTQFVLSAGMAVEVARGDAAQLGGSADVLGHLDRAKELTQTAVQQLRDAIYALHHPDSVDEPAGLADLLAEMASSYRPRLDIGVAVEGNAPGRHPAAEHELVRIAGEALFNVATHSGGSRAMVRLAYRGDHVVLAIADDGSGDPAMLRRLLRVESEVLADGRHRGLTNMATRARALGGGLSFRRARLGGVQVTVRVPLPFRDPAMVGQ